MSKCGSCDLYWNEEKNNYGITCSGNCGDEECVDNLQSLICELRCEVNEVINDIIQPPPSAPPLRVISETFRGD